MPIGGDQDIVNLLVVIVLSLTLAYYLYEAFKVRKTRVEYVTRELLVCTKCNYRVEKDYEAGDFVGLLKGTCPKCGGSMKIRGIYAVEKQSFKTS